ncbi:serpentine type 7TM GPCR receptor class ab chemoreceptor domain-containing protein [Ditylenchus destructor]|nr:serpentine type 7TM GPCR receptor class ab chemoreceptor domain-containing protein [Ditylenchus destructor]
MLHTPVPYQTETLKLGSWCLFVLYVAHVLLSLTGTLLLAVLIMLLRRYDLFHANFRLALWNVLLCILLNNFLQMGRSLLALFQMITQSYTWNSMPVTSQMGHFQEIYCYDLNVMPTAFCAFISVAGIVLCMERLYATFNYTKYEYEDFAPFLTKLFIIMWSIFSVFGLLSAVIRLPAFLTSDYLQCSFAQLSKNPLKTQCHLFLAILFQAAFFVFYWAILKVNKERQEIYIRHHYNSLSSRFQIGENIKGVRLMIWFIATFLVAVALILIQTVYNWSILNENDMSPSARMLSQELTLLILPVFTGSMPTLLGKQFEKESEYQWNSWIQEFKPFGYASSGILG